MERLIPWGIFVSVMTAACFLRPRAMRGVVGVFFALMGLGVHGATLATRPDSYVDFARQALFPAYAQLAEAVVVGLTPRVFGALMLVFEVVLAALMLGSGGRARLGLALGAAFLVGICPLGIEVLPNAVLAIGLVRLSREAYPASALDELRAWKAQRAGRAR